MRLLKQAHGNVSDTKQKKLKGIKNKKGVVVVVVVELPAVLSGATSEKDQRWPAQDLSCDT